MGHRLGLATRTHTESAGYPDKLTVHGGTDIMQVEHTADYFGGAGLK